MNLLIEQQNRLYALLANRNQQGTKFT
jgi:hypothetical protein